jgi:putative ATP-binding cassette transporter
MRLRENSEGVALYNGANYERGRFKNAFMEVVENFYALLKIKINLKFFTVLYANYHTLIPIIAASPRFFAKEIQIGGLMQIKIAFAEIKDAFSFLIDNFEELASYKAVITRLVEFNNNINKWQLATSNNKIELIEKGDEFTINDLSITTPQEKPLLTNLSLSFILGQSYLLSGKNGLGKSTLLRALAGLWVFGAGKVIFPRSKRRFFIPQKPYMPYGSLLNIMLYPKVDGVMVDDVKAIMAQANLGYLIPRLEVEENWSLALSLGEQQKIAIIRAIVNQPDVLIMDESTSALTEADEEVMYRLLKAKLPNVTIISVGHRSTLKAFHDKEVLLV